MGRYRRAASWQRRRQCSVHGLCTYSAWWEGEEYHLVTTMQNRSGPQVLCWGRDATHSSQREWQNSTQQSPDHSSWYGGNGAMAFFLVFPVVGQVWWRCLCLAWSLFFPTLCRKRAGFLLVCSCGHFWVAGPLRTQDLLRERVKETKTPRAFIIGYTCFSGP